MLQSPAEYYQTNYRRKQMNTARLVLTTIILTVISTLFVGYKLYPMLESYKKNNSAEFLLLNSKSSWYFPRNAPVVDLARTILEEEILSTYIHHKRFCENVNSKYINSCKKNPANFLEKHDYNLSKLMAAPCTNKYFSGRHDWDETQCIMFGASRYLYHVGKDRLHTAACEDPPWYMASKKAISVIEHYRVNLQGCTKKA